MADKMQKSKQIRNNWVQFDTLCCGTGWDEADLKNPQILVAYTKTAANRPISMAPTFVTDGQCPTTA